MVPAALRRSLLLATALTVSTPVLAEEAADVGAEEIVVTAVRQAYRGDFALNEIPQSIAVIDTRALQDNNIVRLTDALDLNAGVARQNNFGGLWDAYAVRGFTGDENLPSGYLVNGFNGGRGFGGPRDVAGIERIEILKGPNAALFGRGEPGGTINIVTKQPLFDATRATLSASYGSYKARRADADVNVAPDSRIAVRLIGYYEDAESFRDTIESERFGFLPSVGVRLGEDTTLVYNLELTRQEVPFDRGVVAINGQLGAIPRTRFLGEPGDGPIEADATGHQLQLQHAFSDAWSLLLGGSARSTSLEGFSTEAELTPARQKLLTDGQSLSRQRRFRDYDADHYVVRGELAGDVEIAGMRHRILAGADFDQFENSQLFLRFRPPAVSGNPTDLAANIINVRAPVYGRFPLPAPGPQTNRLDVQKATGFYVQDQIALSDRIQIRLGGRYDSFSLRSLNRANASQQRRSFDRFSPQAGLVWEANPALSLYVSYGEGFRSNIGATAAGAIFDPETSRAFETGAKFGLFGNALTGTVAYFRLTKSNVLAADPANPGFSLPIGKAGSDGIEIDLTGKLPGGLELLASYAYVDAEARSSVLDPNFALQIRAGDRLINVPRHSVNVQVSRTIDLGATELRLGGGVQHVGRRLGETATAFELPAYTLSRLFATWRPTEQIEVFGQVHNLFNETYYTNSFSRLWVQPGTPRTVSAGVRIRI
ncbi:MAG: TonB-dependent siderophore receptor [Alphaproteobacteria bacterium]|nr:TonB-dependent siderophore receptor [Alphaproteobacteria bacterium]